MRFKLIFSYSIPYSSPSVLCSLMQPSFFLCKSYALYCAYVLKPYICQRNKKAVLKIQNGLSCSPAVAGVFTKTNYTCLLKPAAYKCFISIFIVSQFSSPAPFLNTPLYQCIRQHDSKKSEC